MTESIHSKRYRRLRQLLVEARHAQKLSQAAVAEKLKTLQTYVSKYERGERRLDVVEFLDVTAALGLDPHDVLREITAVRETRYKAGS